MKQEYPQLSERIYWEKLSNGLTVAVVPRPGFQRKLAYFVTNFGSVHKDFILDGEMYHMPAGVAHFLEHKLFELPDRDVTAEFSAFGGSVNAFTGYDMTAYYVSCTQHFGENLRLLLEFVSTPYFEAESVLREQGIIDQEIGMNADSPDTRVFEVLMEKMYENHPIRTPILGTAQSIREITPQVLHTCHRAFYNPANMILCVVGDVQPEQVREIALDVLGAEKTTAGEKMPLPREGMTTQGDADMEMEVSMPMFQLGFKCESALLGEASVRQEVVGDLAAEALFGESSQLYLQMYSEGLIDASFGGGFESVDGCALLTCGGDSENPHKIRDAILRRAEEIVAQGMEEEDFLRMKRSALGRRIRDLDSFDSTCFRICAYYFSGFDYFEFPGVYRQVTGEEVQAFLKEVVSRERSALSVITPKQN